MQADKLNVCFGTFCGKTAHYINKKNIAVGKWCIFSVSFSQREYLHKYKKTCILYEKLLYNYVSIYMYVYVYMYKYVYLCLCIYVYISICVYIYI